MRRDRSPPAGDQQEVVAEDGAGGPADEDGHVPPLGQVDAEPGTEAEGYPVHRVRRRRWRSPEADDNLDVNNGSKPEPGDEKGMRRMSLVGWTGLDMLSADFLEVGLPYAVSCFSSLLADRLGRRLVGRIAHRASARRTARRPRRRTRRPAG